MERHHIAGIAVSRRTLLTVISLLIGGLLTAGVLFTGFNTSLSALLTASDPYLEELNELDAQFPVTQQATFAFVPDDGSVFSPDTMAALADLDVNFRQLPLATRVSSLLNYRVPENFQPLLSKAVELYSEDELQQLATRAMQDPLLTGNLLSNNARLVFSVVTVDLNATDIEQRMELAEAVLALRQQLEQNHPGVSVYVSSEVLFEHSSREAMLSDLTSLLPIVILICVATICFCFNSFAFGFCILSHALLTVLSTTGLLGFLGVDFNSVSVMAPLVVVIIAVANSVHIISIYKQQLQSGLNYSDAMSASIAYNIKPVFLTSLTTAIGFLSLNTCSAPAIRDFGSIVALGIGFAFVFTFSFLPSLLVWVAGRIKSHGRNSDPDSIRLVVSKVKQWWQHYDRKLFVGCSSLALLSFALLPLNETDFNRLDFIDSGSELRQYYEAVTTELNRGPSLSYGIATDKIDAAIEPAFLRRVEQFTEWLQQQPEIQSSASLVDLVKTIHRARMGQDQNYYTVPNDINTIATDLDVYASIEAEDFPLAGFINEDFSTLRLFINAVPVSNQGILALDEKISAGFAEFFPEARLVHGSTLLLFARMDELVTVELMRGYSLSLLLITLVLALAFRSWYFGLLTVIPNLFPATIVFGLWGVLVGQIDPFVMMLFSISIGLVVDDTVHLFSHYLDHRDHGMNFSDAFNRSLDTAGPALIVTTAVLALGTTILIAASTLYFQQAAKLLVPIVVLALVLDLVYLPTVLKRFDRRENGKTVSMN